DGPVDSDFVVAVAAVCDDFGHRDAGGVVGVDDVGAVGGGQVVGVDQDGVVIDALDLEVLVVVGGVAVDAHGGEGAGVEIDGAGVGPGEGLVGEDGRVFGKEWEGGEGDVGGLEGGAGAGADDGDEAEFAVGEGVELERGGNVEEAEGPAAAEV